jgi:HEAT repeat protein
MARIVLPFSRHSLGEWIEILQKATSADERYRALLAVNSLGAITKVVDCCRDQLRDADSSVRALAVKLLGQAKSRSGADSIGWAELMCELTERLSDSDIDVRFEAARALGRIQSNDESSKGILLSLLEEDGIQPLMIAAVVSSLAERSDVDLTQLVARYTLLLTDEQAEIRESVSAAIAAWGPQARLMLDPLVQSIEDEEPLVRENVALALGQSGVSSEKVLRALESASTDEDAIVASVAQESLRQLSQSS